jgi:nucleoside-diphosphate-sugar epimerase
MRVLVTGGSGFVGSHLVRRMLARGHRVTSLDPYPGAFDDELRAGGAVLIEGSVGEPGDVDGVMAGQEVVFHLASRSGADQEEEARRVVAVEGTRHVLEAARWEGVRRVVHCSSSEVHGAVVGPPADEDSPIVPSDSLARSKADGELVAQEFIARGLDVVVVRPASVYGPGEQAEWLRLFHRVRRGWLVMPEAGWARSHPVYVENLVDLLEVAATAPQARGRTYLAGDDAVTRVELARAVGSALGTPLRIVRVPFARRRSRQTVSRHFRTERARVELGYRPRVSLREGLARTAAWYQAAGHLPPALPVPPPLPDRRRPDGARQARHAPERRLGGPGTVAPTSP